MKTILSLVALLAATAGLRGQGGASADDSGPAPDALREWSVEETDALLSGLLAAYDDSWEALSRFRFSFVRYAPRGYDRSRSRFLLAGVDLADPATGAVRWGAMTALREAHVSGSVSGGVLPGTFALGAEAGLGELEADPAADVRGGRFGWMFAERRFRYGLRVGGSTGLMRGGWAVSAAVSRRWGHDARIRGVYSDDWTVYAAVAKRWGERHSLTASFVEAPSERGLRSATVAEAFSLTGDPLYNPAWGVQRGRTRSSRVSVDRCPLALLTWRFDPPDSPWRLTTTLAGAWGHSSLSSSDWYDASSPQPDYYRYLPGFLDNPEAAETVREAWTGGDPLVTQIDWEELYRANDLRGDSSAAYVVASDVSRRKSVQLVSSFAYDPSTWVSLTGGLRGHAGRTTCFRRLDDLLGAAYLTDIDPYLIDDRYFGDRLQNDLRHPGRRVVEGEAYGYFYDLDYVRLECWLLVRLRRRNRPRWSGYAGLQAARIGFSRNGRYEKELYAGRASFGRSEPLRFTDWTVKAGVGYRFSPRHGLALDLACGRRAPLAGDAFVSPRYRNETVPGVGQERFLSGELGYRLDAGSVSLTLSLYGTLCSDGTQVRRYYDDLASVYSDMMLSQIGRLYAGAELGAEFRLASRLALRVAAAESRAVYRNDPAVVIRSDKDGHVISDRSRTLLRGLDLGGSPRRVAAAELRYEGAGMWTLSASAAYAGEHYVSPSPLYRMRRVWDRAASPEAVGTLTGQERFPGAATVGLFASKTFRLGARYLSLSGSVDNLFDDRRIVHSGYESMRLRKIGSGAGAGVEPFGSKYLYAYGRTCYLTLNFRF